jgi:hypothetical protein
MSILSALKTQQGSIRELAALPQQQILKMAQMGQLDVSMVPVILNEKAQMVQQVANMQAMAQQMPPTEIEQAMAINAQAEVPQQPAGIESLPQGAEMFNETSLAGGGIVAFEDGGAVPRFQSQGMVPGTFDMFMPDETPTTPLAEVLVPEELAGRVGLAQIYDIKSGKYGRKKEDILRAFGIAATPAMTQQAAPTAAPAPASAPTAAPAAAPGSAEARVAAAPTTPAAPAVKPKTIQDYLAEAKAEGPQGEAYSELEKEIRGGAGQKKAEREQNMWMRIAEAGFGIMSGESPYAMTNLGKGMSSAMKSYAEDLREQKKLDREDRRTLADIEQARRAEQKGQYDKAVDRYEKALNRMSEDDRARLQRETQVKVAGMSASQRPSPFQEYLSNPEKYAEFSRAIRPGFENADLQRDKTNLDLINNSLMTMKKDDPERKRLEATRARIMDKIMGQIPSFGGALTPPPNIEAVLKKYGS